MKRRDVEYLTLEQVLLIHSMLIDETGGLHGIRDQGAVQSAVAAPAQAAFGQDLNSGLFRKAAVYARSIIMHHPFLDGNKRTGMACAGVFLETNGWMLQAGKGELADFAVAVVEARLDHEAIEEWLRSHAIRINGA